MGGSIQGPAVSPVLDPCTLRRTMQVRPASRFFQTPRMNEAARSFAVAGLPTGQAQVWALSDGERVVEDGKSHLFCHTAAWTMLHSCPRVLLQGETPGVPPALSHCHVPICCSCFCCLSLCLMITEWSSLTVPVGSCGCFNECITVCLELRGLKTHWLVLMKQLDLIQVCGISGVHSSTEP